MTNTSSGDSRTARGERIASSGVLAGRGVRTPKRLRRTVIEHRFQRISDNAREAMKFLRGHRARARFRRHLIEATKAILGQIQALKTEIMGGGGDWDTFGKDATERNPNAIKRNSGITKEKV